MNVVGAFTYLIQAVFSIYSILVVARFMLQLGDADFYNPISQTVVKCTRIPLMAIRKIIPSFGRFDAASFVWLFVVQLLMFVVLGLISGSIGMLLAHPLMLILGAAREVASLILNFWLFAIFIEVIGSWFAMGQYNPLLDLVSQVTRPIMDPIRRVIPSMGGLDLSPMVALLGIVFFKQLFGL